MEKLTSIKEEGLAKIAACESLHDLQELRVLYLGKKGPIQEVMKSMKDLPKEERPAFGQQVNEVKTMFADAIEERKQVLEIKEMEEKIEKEKIDITLDGQKPNQMCIRDRKLPLLTRMHSQPKLKLLFVRIPRPFLVRSWRIRP